MHLSASGLNWSIVPKVLKSFSVNHNLHLSFVRLDYVLVFENINTLDVASQTISIAQMFVHLLRRHRKERKLHLLPVRS